MSEKALSIGFYAVASGIFTVLGTVPPVLGSKNVTDLPIRSAENVIGGKFAVESDPVKGAELMLEHIEGKRRKLGGCFQKPLANLVQSPVEAIQIRK
jgi:carbon-monoxide dehydrogenase catalytic subunit